jgi:hypothetical protein
VAVAARERTVAERGAARWQAASPSGAWAAAVTVGICVCSPNCGRGQPPICCPATLGALHAFAQRSRSSEAGMALLRMHKGDLPEYVSLPAKCTKRQPAGQPPSMRKECDACRPTWQQDGPWSLDQQVLVQKVSFCEARPIKSAGCLVHQASIGCIAWSGSRSGRYKTGSVVSLTRALPHRPSSRQRVVAAVPAGHAEEARVDHMITINELPDPLLAAVFVEAGGRKNG